MILIISYTRVVKFMRLEKIVFLLALIFILTSCGGGGAATYYMHRNTTTGQELTDLQAAYQKGALTEDEYLSQKARILKGDLTRAQ